MDTATKHYTDRDAMALDKAGGYYARHVFAMTAEQLHAKSDIAAELGWRDMQIDQMRQKLDDEADALTVAYMSGYSRGKHPSTAIARRIKGVRVDGDRVVVAVKGGNDAARWLCEQIVLLIESVPAQQAPDAQPAKRSAIDVQHLPSDDTEGGAT